MRIKPGESYEDWATRARLYEYGVALKSIAEGNDPDVVLEQLSKRLVSKLMHPLIKELQVINKEQIIKSVEKSRLRYEEEYLKRVLPKSDHVDD